jgi:ribosome-associated protein YbcJ (S4-like RNA binding protein)
MITISFVNLDHVLRLVKINDLRQAHIREGSIFTNHIDEARKMKKEVMPKEL